MPVLPRRGHEIGEPVQEGNGAQPRAGGGGRVGGPGDACGSAQQPLDLIKKDPREGRDCRGAVGNNAAQSLGHGDHPLPHRVNDSGFHRFLQALRSLHTFIGVGKTGGQQAPRHFHDRAASSPIGSGCCSS
jgi:hypothetical protein